MKKDLAHEISKLESQISAIQKNLDLMKETLQNLKDIAWDKESKKESAKMTKILNGSKDSTAIQSNVGAICVDRDFMEKEAQKHLDNPNLRGMVTSQEMLSFPKVARNVEPQFDKRIGNYTWKVKANDGSTIRYGSRKYDNQNRLLTAYSETEKGKRDAGVGEQGQPHHLINDLNFLRPANEIIPQDSQNLTQSNATPIVKKRK